MFYSVSEQVAATLSDIHFNLFPHEPVEWAVETVADDVAYIDIGFAQLVSRLALISWVHWIP